MAAVSGRAPCPRVRSVRRCPCPRWWLACAHGWKPSACRAPDREFAVPAIRTSPRKFRSLSLAVAGSAVALAAVASGAAAGSAVGTGPSAASTAAGASQATAVGPAGAARAAVASPVRAAGAADLAGPAGQVTLVAATQPVQTARAAAAAATKARRIARKMLHHFHWWRPQFKPLNKLWTLESGWNRYASNPYSGAYGIPQALPGSKMASAGPNWTSSARTQIRWGLGYIKAVYGSPRKAWRHERAYGWY